VVSLSNQQFGIGKLKPKEMIVSDLQKALSIDKKAVQAVEEAQWKRRRRTVLDSAGGEYISSAKKL